MRLCGRTRKLLGAYHDGELTAGQQDAVQQHVEQCAGCREALRQIERLGRVGSADRSMPDVSDPEWERRWMQIRQRLGGGTVAEPIAPRRAWLWRRPAWASAAAAAVLIAAGVLFAFGVIPHSLTTQAAEPGCIVTLLESDVENSAVMYYRCDATDVSMITLIRGEAANGGD